jgi:beta-glucuronidase
MTGQPLAQAGWVLRPQTNSCRTALDLSGVWGLRLDPADEGRERGWWRAVPDPVPVAVPGSWNEQVPGARDTLGPAWYERRFEAPPAAGQQVAIRFGSAVYAAQAWLNGQWLGEHEGGHLPFTLPCSAALAEGENVLVVRVDGRLGRDRVPPGLVPAEHSHGRVFHPDVPFDFFPFAGLHRRVELVATPRHGIGDLRVRTVTGGDGTATLHVAAEAGGGELTLALDGEPITCPHRVGREQLWHPDSPRLHRLDAELRRRGALVDRYTLQVGLRTVTVDADRLLLNGAPVELRGFGRHEDFPVLGRGAVPALAARDLLLMRDLGANSLRTAHYPCDEETLDIADRLGLLVIAETPAVGLYFAAAGMPRAGEDLARRQELALRFVAELVARDRNRACVIAWSVANEPRMNYPGAAAALGELCDAARALDATRPAGYATDLPDSPGLEAADVVFLNAYPGWYHLPADLDAAESALGGQLDRIHERHAKPIVITEFGADAIPGSHADPPALWSEEYQAELIERLIRVARQRPFVAGAHVWAFADFATAQATHRPQSRNYKGVFTRDRQPKLAAHRLRALWGGERAGPVHDIFTSRPRC